jgi:hypothetical protein
MKMTDSPEYKQGYLAGLNDAAKIAPEIQELALDYQEKHWVFFDDEEVEEEEVPHDHPYRVKGCFRCELSMDEHNNCPKCYSSFALAHPNLHGVYHLFYLFRRQW